VCLPYVEGESFYGPHIAHEQKIILNGAGDIAPAAGIAWSAGLGGMLWGLMLAGFWLVGLL
jgi:hypothetical protein